MNRLSDTLKIIKENRIEFIDEASITSLINGVLFAYDWNVFDPYEVEPQHYVFDDSVYSGRVDVALKLFGHRKIFVEIKQSTQKLEKHETQIRDYLRKTVDVPVGVLTNAESWWFYTCSKDENNEIRIKSEEKVNVYLDSESKIDAIFSKYLSKTKLVEEWYQTNLDILDSSNSNSTQKLSSLLRLRSMNDKGVIEPLLNIFNQHESDMIRSSALFGLVELNNKNNLETSQLKHLLEIALTDQSLVIREKAKKSLEELNYKK